MPQWWSRSTMQPHIDAARRLVVFHHYVGNGANIDCTTLASPRNIEFCSSAFNAIWELAIPRSDYKPT